MSAVLVAKDTNIPMEEVVEHKELDPTNLEDLNFLLYNAERLIKDILSYEKIAQSENFSSLIQYSTINNEVFSKSREVFERLKDIVKIIKHQVNSYNLTLEDSQIDEIQNLYDGLISIRNTFLRTYCSLYELEVFDSETDSEANPAEVVNSFKSELAGEISETDKLDEEVNRFEVVPVVVTKAKTANQNFGEEREVEDGFEEYFKIDSDINSSDMVVKGEDIEFAIPIKLAPDTEKEIINHLAKEFEQQDRVLFVEKNLSFDESNALARTKENDPINRVVQVKENIFTKGSYVKTKNDSKKGYIVDDSYKQINKQNQSSKESSEKKLTNFVKKFELQSLDGFERWLNTEYESTFELIKDMTLTAVINMSGENNIRKELIAANYKYETFVAWVEFGVEIKEYFGHIEDIKFSDLIHSFNSRPL